MTVAGKDYDVLYRACERRQRPLFPLERRDYRNGILTTRPVDGGQLLEIWRRDIPDAYSVAESNLAAVRRTIRFGSCRDEGWLAEVVVERQALLERRVTLGILNRTCSAARRCQDTTTTTRTSPTLPHWYATRRDENLEPARRDPSRQLVESHPINGFGGDAINPNLAASA